MKLWIDQIESPIGAILVVTDDAAVYAIEFADQEARMLSLLQRRFTDLEFQAAENPLGVSDRLCAYFDREFDAIADIPVNTGGTDFQQTVWLALRSIPIGSVVSYGQLATQLGNANASRAVGMANSLNPVSIVLPCHRVIGSDSSLTGYAGGLERKRWLLEHEGFELKKASPSASDQLTLF
jgi:methylated-DNA-[protein]-cysteine S-methyltransferase